MSEFIEDRPISELFLLHLRYKLAQTLVRGGGATLTLDNAATSWVVYRGSADLFAVPTVGGQPSGARTHLARLTAGQAAFGVAPIENVTLLLVGNANANLLKLETRQLQLLALDDLFAKQVVDLVDDWVRHLATAPLAELPPKTCQRVAAGTGIDLSSGTAICTKRDVLWLRHLRGRSQFATYDELPYLNGKLRWPLSERGWVQTTEPSQLDLIDTAAYLRESPIWADLFHFNQVILRAVAGQIDLNAAQDIVRMGEKSAEDADRIDHALNQLAAPFVAAEPIADATPTDDKIPHITALRLIMRHHNITLGLPPDEVPLSLASIARASHCQTRRVALRDEWWKHDNGALFATIEETNRPVALLPTRKGYTLFNPEENSYQPVTPEVADTLKPFADMVYRTLPTTELTVWQLLKFGLQGDLSDLRRIALLGSGAGLLALLVPLAVGQLIDQIIPTANRPQLWQMSGILLVVTLAMTLFRVVQNLSVLRLQSRLGADLQAAVWDRVLNMPVAFFRNYTSGDLGNRVLGITQMEQILSGTVLNALLSGIFSIFSLALLYIYDGQLALVATGLVLVTLVVTIWIGRKQLHIERALTNLQGKIASHILQALTGIAKFRSAGAEGRAFSTWATHFGQYKRLDFQSRDLSNSLHVFNAAFQLLTTLTIFAVVMFANERDLTTGQFLAFNAAFIQFFGAMLVLSNALVTLLYTVPLYERARPILQTRPEIDLQKAHPGEIFGRIEAAHVSFRYEPDTPLVLDDVSFEAKPGEFIAIVGASGSGKSTLLRVLLGFEQPEAGAVYYDNQDLREVDVREVRRQIGVVLQNGQISGGDIENNIIGAFPLDLDDAWEAARLSGLAADIEAMPMKMHTVLSDGGGTLSGGQRQRLLIARAIVNRPRILYFDEATSALDSQTQAVVSESLENLQATRVVIAHRLSTIMHADRIYVMDAGCVVEQGSYQELMDTDGLFAQLAQRQLA